MISKQEWLSAISRSRNGMNGKRVLPHTVFRAKGFNNGILAEALEPIDTVISQNRLLMVKLERLM